jgi:hypothetical protein
MPPKEAYRVRFKCHRPGCEFRGDEVDLVMELLGYDHRQARAYLAPMLQEFNRRLTPPAPLGEPGMTATGPGAPPPPPAPPPSATLTAYLEEVARRRQQLLDLEQKGDSALPPAATTSSPNGAFEDEPGMGITSTEYADYCREKGLFHDHQHTERRRR